MGRALVVFEHNNLHPLSPLLKRGFRHVFCAVVEDNGRAWVEHNLHGTEYVTTSIAPLDYDLAGYYRDLGMIVVEYERPRHRVLGWLLANSCVGTVKHVLGIRSWAVTPFQLYQYLIKREAQHAA